MSNNFWFDYYKNKKQEEDKNIIEIVAERVTFLSSRKGTEEE